MEQWDAIAPSVAVVLKTGSSVMSARLPNLLSETHAPPKPRTNHSTQTRSLRSRSRINWAVEAARRVSQGRAGRGALSRRPPRRSRCSYGCRQQAPSHTTRAAERERVRAHVWLAWLAWRGGGAQVGRDPSFVLLIRIRAHAAGWCGLGRRPCRFTSRVKLPATYDITIYHTPRSRRGEACFGAACQPS
eukprot:scaffold133463_cov78-Phaeocystis_antarctica.AAC.3